MRPTGHSAAAAPGSGKKSTGGWQSWQKALPLTTESRAHKKFYKKPEKFEFR